MQRAVSLVRFFSWTVAWFFLATVAWLQVSDWTSYPASGIAHIVLGNGAGDWVRSVDKSLGHVEVNTRIILNFSEGKQGELVAEVDPSRYAYSLPLFLSLLLASGSRHLFWRALAGYILLLIPQAFSLSLDILKQIIVAAGNPAQLGIAQWQMESIALGYQFGTLLLPTLSPIILWMWLDRAFFTAVVLDGWLRKAAKE